MPTNRRRYRFVISESFTPETLPMARLAEYLGDLAELLGEKTNVHFVAVEHGSAVLVQEVEHEAYPKVRARLQELKRGEGPTEGRRAYDAINRRLACDNALGELLEEPAPGEAGTTPMRVLQFPGRNTFVEPEYGPITQAATLQGIVIVVGGESDPVPVHLQDGEVVHVCRAKRALAKELATHIFSQPIRVSGNGRWLRDSTGQWIMRSFMITGYELLQDDPLSTVVARLREVKGEWKERRDAQYLFHDLRAGEV